MADKTHLEVLRRGVEAWNGWRDDNPCRHRGPSSLDHRTLARSGELPLSFLRGCGLPDSLIEYLPTLLLDGPFPFCSCFIRYSRKDEAFAECLHADLQDNGVRCWFAPEDAEEGRAIHGQADRAIQVYDRLLLVLSEQSVGSEWVRTEIAEARQMEMAGGSRILFPLRLVDFETIREWKYFDVDAGRGTGREGREYFTPDFSNWKDHDAYRKAFERLLRDLKTERKAGA